MDYKIITPSTLWQDYDPTAMPLEVKNISDNIISDNIRELVCTYVAMAKGENKVRIFTRILIPSVDTVNVIVAVQDYHRELESDLALDLAKNGYIVVIPDFSGVSKDSTTFYPPELEYGYISKAGEHLYQVCPTPLETNQYLYSIAIKRAITLSLELVKNANIAVIGLGDAVEVAMQVVGSETRKILGLACINGSGYREYINYNKFSKEQDMVIDECKMAWLTGVASVAYAKRIECPTFISIGSNSILADIDRLSNLVALLPEGTVTLSTSPGVSDCITLKAVQTLFIWLKSIFFAEDSLPQNPKLNINVNNEGNIYAEVDVDNKRVIFSVNVYYSLNEIDHRLRSYTKLSCLLASPSQYLANISLPSKGIPLFAYAEVIYDNGVTVSSELEYVDLKGINVLFTPYKNKRKIYQGSDGIANIVLQSNKRYLPIDDLRIVTTQSGSQGVTADFGFLKTFAFGTRIWESEDKLLSIYCSASKLTTITFELTAREHNKLIEYTHTVECHDTQGLFFGFNLKPQDFKDKNLKSLESWADIKALAVYGVKIILGSILFI